MHALSCIQLLKKMNSQITSLQKHHMSIKEACEYTTLSERFIRGLIAKKKLKAAHVGGRVILRTVDIDRFLQEGTNHD